MKRTTQQNFWLSNFGKKYTERNIAGPKELDKIYIDRYGLSRSAMNDQFLKNLALEDILEVGCNVGDMLNLLQTQGYNNLFGIEIQEYAVERAKQLTKNINIIQGSAFD